MSADDYYSDNTPQSPDHDAKVPDENWTPGPSLISIEDDGEVTWFPDVECESETAFMSRWISVDADYAIPRREWR